MIHQSESNDKSFISICRKVLFLDFDGVVNSHESFHLNHLARTKERELRGEGAEFAPQFCFPMGHLYPPLIERLNKIMEQTDCHIVVSSAWRIGHSVEQLAEWLTKKGFCFGNKIIDRTGQNSKDARGGEIQDWLDEHPEVTQYVVLDDDSADIIGDYTTKKHPENFVHTDGMWGLQDVGVEKAIKILNKTLDSR